MSDRQPTPFQAPPENWVGGYVLHAVLFLSGILLWYSVGLANDLCKAGGILFFTMAYGSYIATYARMQERMLVAFLRWSTAPTLALLAGWVIVNALIPSL